MSKRNRLGVGEFANVYSLLKSRWDEEVSNGLHSQRGFHTNLSKTMGVQPGNITNTVRGMRGGAPRLTARQWLALSKRFGFPVESLLRVASNQVFQSVSAAG